MAEKKEEEKEEGEKEKRRCSAEDAWASDMSKRYVLYAEGTRYYFEPEPRGTHFAVSLCDHLISPTDCRVRIGKKFQEMCMHLS